MGFDSLIRGLIRNTMDPVMKSLQDEVTHYRFIGESGFGPRLDSGVAVSCIVEYMDETREDQVVIRAKLLVLEEMEEVAGVPDRINPVDPRDRFGLPDGTRAEVVSVPGIADPQSGSPYFAEVTVGDKPK